MNIKKALIMFAVSVCWTVSAQATDWPRKSVTIVVPYSPGGSVDYSARYIAQRLTQVNKQSFVAVNKPGASGTIGTALAADSAPDGYTLLLNNTSYAMFPSMFASLPWDHANAFEPIGMVMQTQTVLIVGPNSPFRTLAELVDHGRKNPGKLNFGSAGIGSSTHLYGEMFQHTANFDAVHVPYKGASQVLLAVMSGQIDFAVLSGPTAIPQILGDKARALAITGTRRTPVIKQVPTFAEAGLPAFAVNNWFGLVAPKGTPKPIIDKLARQLTQILAEPGLQQQFAELGAEPGDLTTIKFKRFIEAETQRWTAAAKKAKIQPE